MLSKVLPVFELCGFECIECVKGMRPRCSVKGARVDYTRQVYVLLTGTM
jgi:hypothetical protein